MLRGKLEELLESEDHAWAEDAYCQITLTDAERPAQAMERLRARFPDTLVLGFDPAGPGREANNQLQQQAGRGRGRPLGLLRLPGPRPRPGTPTTPNGLRPRGGPGQPCGWRRHRCEDPPAANLRVRALRRHRGHRLRPAQRARAVPAQRRHRRRQDQRPGRHLLRALRLGAGRAPGRQAAAQRPRRARRGTPVSCEFSARAGTSKSPARRRGTSPAPAGRTDSPRSRPTPSCANASNGDWTEKSGRNDEAGAEITGLLGMDREQFTRVVMLPQGDFAAFLRSKAADRLDAAAETLRHPAFRSSGTGTRPPGPGRTERGRKPERTT